MDCGACHDCAECCAAFHTEESNANCSICQQSADTAYWNWVDLQIDISKERAYEKQL